MHYKLLNIGHPHYPNMSSVNRVPEFQHRIIYRHNKWVYPRIGKLFVFKRLSDAEMFTYEFSCWRPKIFGCEVENPQYQSRVAMSWCIGDFWANNGFAMTDIAPKGTYICDAVKILGEIL